VLCAAGLAPSTINTRLSALKSLVQHARKQQQCRFSLEYIPHVSTTQKLSRHLRLDTLMIYDDNRKGLQGKASGVLADLI
jgi:integrase/recombinase XerC